MPQLPTELLADPAKLVCTWTAPIAGNRGGLTIQAYPTTDKLALPMLLNNEQQAYALDQFAQIIAGPQITRARASFALVLGMLETVADSILVDGSDEAIAGPDGNPVVPVEWVHAFRSITKHRPKTAADLAGAGDESGAAADA